MNCLAVYHVACEDLGTLAAPLRERLARSLPTLGICLGA